LGALTFIFSAFESSGLASFGMFILLITLIGAAIYCSLIGPADTLLLVFFFAKSLVNDLPGPSTIYGFLLC
jgi:hypothetical protein